VQNDVTYVAIMLALFAVSILFIKACDRLIGQDDAALGRQAEDSRVPVQFAEQDAA
jgi:hypothetical protein